MKNISPLALIKAAALMAVFSSVTLRAAETNTVPVRIGTYDSRAVAFAWFGSAEHQNQMSDLVRTAKAAKAAGDTNRFAEFGASLRAQQDEIHREVFSTAPPTEALAEIKDRLPEIQQTAGATSLVSKWDAAMLKNFSTAEKVDVTERLVREFHPTDKQLKTITSIEKSEPLSLQKCEELIRKGEI